MDSSLPPSYREVMELNIPPTSYFQLFGRGPSDPDETTIEIVPPPPSHEEISTEGPSIETTIEIPDGENQEIRIQRRRHSNQETNLSCWGVLLIILLKICIIIGALFVAYIGLITLSGPVFLSLMISLFILGLLADFLMILIVLLVCPVRETD